MPFKCDGDNHMLRVVVPKTTFSKLNDLADRETINRGRAITVSTLVRNGIREVLKRGGMDPDTV